MQFMYGFDMNELELDRALENFWLIVPVIGNSRGFAEQLVQGVLEHRQQIDDLITRNTINWNIDRFAIIDRNILRIAAYEMLYCKDIPPIVSINEAVDIAKKYSTPDSGKFVNGILDKLRRVVTRRDDSEKTTDRFADKAPGSEVRDAGWA